jgi:hypothetical protein
MRKKLFLLILLFAFPCWAQEVKTQEVQSQEEKPQKVKKRRVMDIKFWLAALAVVGTTVLDVETTSHCLRNSSCREGNPIFGRNPSRARLYGVKGSLAGFTICSTWWWKRDDIRRMERFEHRNDPGMPEPRLWEEPRPSWYLPSVIYGGITGAAGIYNLTHKLPKTASLPPQPAQPISQPGN